MAIWSLPGTAPLLTTAFSTFSLRESKSHWITAVFYCHTVLRERHSCPDGQKKLKIKVLVSQPLSCSSWTLPFLQTCSQAKNSQQGFWDAVTLWNSLRSHRCSLLFLHSHHLRKRQKFLSDEHVQLFPMKMPSPFLPKSSTRARATVANKEIKWPFSLPLSQNITRCNIQ